MRTQVTNLTSTTRFFSYIPPHGQNIEAGQKIVVDADLRTYLAVKFGVRSREMASLNNDIANNILLVNDLEEELSA